MKQQTDFIYQCALLLTVPGFFSAAVEARPMQFNAPPSTHLEQLTQNPTLLKLTGVTSKKVNAKSGIITLNKACNTEYPGSRMCTTVEILNSTASIAFSPVGLWVRPVIQPIPMYSEFPVSPKRPIQFEVGSGFSRRLSDYG